jgi:hypothetical protein
MQSQYYRQNSSSCKDKTFVGDLLEHYFVPIKIGRLIVSIMIAVFTSPKRERGDLTGIEILSFLRHPVAYTPGLLFSDF